MDKSPTRVLLLLTDFKKGGVQAEVMYPARILSREDVQFDVMLFSDLQGFYEEEFSNYGQIYRIPLHRKKTKIQRALSIFTNYFYVKKKLLDFLKEHPYYDALHIRHLTLNAPCISAAKKAGIPVRIAYCAVNRPTGELKDRFLVTLYLKMCARVLRKKATHIFGVTASAVEYIAGKGNGVVIKNPTIALDKFNPDIYPNKNTNDDIRLIMVGSFSSRKNQKFSVEILSELCKKKPDSKLTLIGYPRSLTETYVPELKQMITDLGIDNNVAFLPQDADIPLEMSKSTILLMPSIQEGLPNVALEAQAMGLPCFISTDVSTECDCGLCYFYERSKGAAYWADKIIEYVEKNGFEKTYPDMSQWDNRKVSEMYLEIWRGRKQETL